MPEVQGPPNGAQLRMRGRWTGKGRQRRKGGEDEVKRDGRRGKEGTRCRSSHLAQ